MDLPKKALKSNHGAQHNQEHCKQEQSNQGLPIVGWLLEGTYLFEKAVNKPPVRCEPPRLGGRAILRGRLGRGRRPGSHRLSRQDSEAEDDERKERRGTTCHVVCAFSELPMLQLPHAGPVSRNLSTWNPGKTCLSGHWTTTSR